jgi:threonine aldolase
MQSDQIDFRSDNCASVRPDVLAAIATANEGTAASYGDDALSAALNETYSALFEHPVQVFPVATGIAANALSIACLTPPYGAVYVHETAHLQNSECGASEFYTGGAKLMPLQTGHPKLDARSLAAALAIAGKGNPHKIQPATLSLTQATDLGVSYSPAEIAALTAIAREHGLGVHMDGARFANALVFHGATPAEMTWRAGAEMLSFGATKNGVMNTEAVVCFNPKHAEALNYRRLRAGLVWSKMRFAAAQLLAYVEDGRWLETARWANAGAARIGAAIEGLPLAKLAAPIEANEVFVDMPESALSGLERDGVEFFRVGPLRARFVCRWNVTDLEIDRLIHLLHSHCAANPAQAAAQ